MKLIIDIGNTKTKLALFSGKKIISKKILNQCTFKLVKDFVSDAKITSSIISSVKDFNNDVTHISNYYNSIILTHYTQIPINNLYKTPETLGNDRIALVVGGKFFVSKKRCYNN